MENENLNSDLIRGLIDVFLLKVLTHGDSYGYEIIKKIYRMSEETYELKEPSLYTSLKRLEKGAYIESYWGDESKGGRRKYYHITDKGTKLMQESQKQWVAAEQIIHAIMFGGNVDEK